MAKGSIGVWDVLQRRAQGQKISLREGQIVTDAVEALRAEFLNDVYEAMQHPETLDPGAIPCMAIMGKLLQKHGIVSSEEMENLIKGFGMMTR